MGDSEKLGRTVGIEHKIVPRSDPIKQLDEELDKILALGVIGKSDSSWSGSILLVRKKNGKYSFVWTSERWKIPKYILPLLYLIKAFINSRECPLGYTTRLARGNDL